MLLQLEQASVRITVTISVPVAQQDDALTAMRARLTSPDAATSFLANVGGGISVESIDLPPTTLTNATRVEDPNAPLIVNLTSTCPGARTNGAPHEGCRVHCRSSRLTRRHTPNACLLPVWLQAPGRRSPRGPPPPP